MDCRGMKAVILAGGFGSRLSEETVTRPKPMVEVGGNPIIWHIMKIFSAHGVEDFIICLGYRGYMIKEYFSNYLLHKADITVDLGTGNTVLHNAAPEKWRVTLVDTGEETMTGGRLSRVANHLGTDPFFFTYGDGVADVDLGALARFHRTHGRLATLTAVPPPGRFGVLDIADDLVVGFSEKTDNAGFLINGGFFVLDPASLRYIEGDATSWEMNSLPHLAADRQLVPWKHQGFWHPMDTLRDKHYLDRLWMGGKAPWKVWP